MDNIKEVINGRGLRYNIGKVKFTHIPAEIRQHLFMLRYELPFSQVPMSSLISLANHYDFAQTVKYPNSDFNGLNIVPNWSKGQWINEMYLSSAYRHLYAYNAGEINDSDLGSHHIISVAWNLASIYHQLSNPELYKQFDDRFWKYFRSNGKPEAPTSVSSTDWLDFLNELLPYIEMTESPSLDLIIVGIGICLWIVYVDRFNVYDTSKLLDIDMKFEPVLVNKDYGKANTAKG